MEDVCFCLKRQFEHLDVGEQLVLLKVKSDPEISIFYCFYSASNSGTI